MWGREYGGSEAVEAAETFDEGLPRLPGKIILLGVESDEERQPIRGKEVENARVPLRCALRPWWRVATCRLPWIVKPHRHQGDFRWIVEFVQSESSPLTKAVPAVVLPGNPAIVDLSSRRLADDKDP